MKEKSLETLLIYLLKWIKFRGHCQPGEKWGIFWKMETMAAEGATNHTCVRLCLSTQKAHQKSPWISGRSWILLQLLEPSSNVKVTQFSPILWLILGLERRDLRSSSKRKSRGTHRVHGGGSYGWAGLRDPQRYSNQKSCALPRFIYWVLYQISFDKKGSKSENHCFRATHRGFKYCNS